MSIPENLKYTEEHEWLNLEGDTVTVGITEYAQGELGDVVYVDLPSPGDRFEQNDPFGSIEAVKAAADLYTPLAGEIVEVNNLISENPETVNKDPYGDGWMIKIKPDDMSALEAMLDAAAYKNHIG